MLGLSFLADSADFQLSCIRISPSRRTVEGPVGVRHLQPQVMIVFLSLVRQRGVVVSRRELFDSCWGGAAVGDDSLNRTLTSIRRALEDVGAEGIAIETVPRSGYRLVIASDDSEEFEDRDKAVEAAWDVWRLGLPKTDPLEIAELDQVLTTSGGSGRDWGVLALLCRKSVEYADAPDCADLVRRCENAARRALAVDPAEPLARVALTGLTPLFGNWTAIRADLLEALEAAPDEHAALHDLAVLEMATGRPSAAIPIIEQLLVADRFAATFHYKRMYHLWTIGDLPQAEQVAARAMALWPEHPAIWMARYWTLMFTKRANQALRMALDDRCGNFLPAPLLMFLRRTADLVGRRGSATDQEVQDHIDKALAVAARGPAQSVAALMALCALGAIDEAHGVACAYYLGTGRSAAPMRWSPGDPCITDQHRRVTQPLFVPSGERLRAHPQFSRLCDDIGLSAYWDDAGIVPDFLLGQASTTVPPNVRE